jgi:hypothetical protein
MREFTMTASKVYPPKGKSPALVLPEERDHPGVKIWPDLWEKVGAVSPGQTISVKGKTQYNDFSKKDEFMVKEYEFGAGGTGASDGPPTSGAPTSPLLTRDQGMAAMGFAHRQATLSTDSGELAGLYATGFEGWKLFEEYLRSADKPVEHKAEDGLPTDEIPF